MRVSDVGWIENPIFEMFKTAQSSNNFCNCISLNKDEFKRNLIQQLSIQYDLDDRNQDFKTFCDSHDECIIEFVDNVLSKQKKSSLRKRSMQGNENKDVLPSLKNKKEVI